MPCPNGHATPADAAFCPTCGSSLTSAPLQPYAYPARPNLYASGVAIAVSDMPRGMYTAAAIINWVVLGLIVVGTVGFGIIVAAWFIPMTIQMHKGARSPHKHTALGVCTLLFCNWISGILLLIDDSGRPTRPPYA
jgi:hypothetical protein